MPDPNEPYNPVNPANTWDPSTMPPPVKPIVDGKPDTPDVPHDPAAHPVDPPYDPSVPNSFDQSRYLPPSPKPEIIRPKSTIDNTSKRILVKKIILGCVVTVSVAIVGVAGYAGYRQVTSSGGSSIFSGGYESEGLNKYMSSLSTKSVTVLGNSKVGLPDTKVTMLYPAKKPGLWEDVTIVGPKDPKDYKEKLKYISQLCGGPVCGTIQFPQDGSDWYGTVNVGGSSYALSGILGWGLKFSSPISNHFASVEKDIKDSEKNDLDFVTNIKVETVKKGVYLAQFDTTDKEDSADKAHSYYIIMERKSTKGSYYANVEVCRISFHKSVSASDQTKYINDMEKAVKTIANSMSYSVE